MLVAYPVWHSWNPLPPENRAKPVLVPAFTASAFPGDLVRETLRLSDAPEFHDILYDFALRLTPGLSREDVVLANIHTELKYRDGQRFAYTLDPANFRVTDLDEAEWGVSPINGTRRLRRVTYDIRDEGGDWHGSIGITCIYQDILQLRRKEAQQVEDALLAALVGLEQARLLEAAGDDLRVYSRANQLHDGMLAQAYLDALEHDDPIREHLRQLLHHRLPFSRAALRLLRIHARQHAVSDIEAILNRPAATSRSPRPHGHPWPLEPGIRRSHWCPGRS